MKRRKMAKDFAEERVRMLCLKRNTILPKEIRVIYYFAKLLTNFVVFTFLTKSF